VTPDSPAAKADLKSGDIITAAGDRELETARHPFDTYDTGVAAVMADNR